MNRIKEVLEERGIKQTLHGQCVCLQQATAQSGSAVSDSGNSKGRCEGFDKRKLSS